MKRSSSLIMVVLLAITMVLPQTHANAGGALQAPQTQTGPATSWSAQCRNETVDVLGTGLVGVLSQTQTNLTIPSDATWSTIQVGGAGYKKIPPTSVNLNFADGSQSVLASPATYLLATASDFKKIAPPLMMAYQFLANGKPGNVGVKLFETKPPTTTGEAVVAYYGKPTVDKFTTVGATTLQYAWGGEKRNYAITSTLLTLTLPQPLVKSETITVKAVVMEKDTQTATDRRIALVKVSAGGITNGTGEKLVGPVNGRNLNIVTVTLQDVPAGTTAISVNLESPFNAGSQMNTDGAGDSVLLLGATASIPCTPDAATDTPTNTTVPVVVDAATDTPTNLDKSSKFQITIEG